MEMMPRKRSSSAQQKNSNSRHKDKKLWLFRAFSLWDQLWFFRCHDVSFPSLEQKGSWSKKVNNRFPKAQEKRNWPSLCMILIAAASLSGCASQRSPYGRYYQGSGAYRAPGTAADPWGPYILAAAKRFSVPQEWIRAVIHQESGGHEYLNGQPITSSAGAMGLMQLMPQTYADMQDRYGLGSDPYEPHDNIMAGTGYIHILSAKYGAPAFLAAYNAGPQRLESYLYDGRRLPNETTSYVANITPHLGTQVAMTGPLAMYATADQLNASPAIVTSTPQTQTATDMIASNAPQRSVQQAWASRNIGASMPAPSAIPCDADAAYDPDVPCKMQAPPSPELPPPTSMETVQSAPLNNAGTVRLASYRPPPPVIPTPHRLTASSLSDSAAASYGSWAVQVGAFANPGQARFAATMARQAAFTPLQGAQVQVQPTVSHGMRFWRARLAGISRSGAAKACSSLSGQGMACMAVPPDHQG